MGGRGGYFFLSWLGRGNHPYHVLAWRRGRWGGREGEAEEGIPHPVLVSGRGDPVLVGVLCTWAVTIA